MNIVAIILRPIIAIVFALFFPLGIYVVAYYFGGQLLLEKFAGPNGSEIARAYIKVSPDLNNALFMFHKFVFMTLLPLSILVRNTYRLVMNKFARGFEDGYSIPLSETGIYAIPAIILAALKFSGKDFINYIPATTYFIIYNLYIVAYLAWKRDSIFPLNLVNKSLRYIIDKVQTKRRATAIKQSVVADLTKQTSTKAPENVTNVEKGKALESLAAEIFRRRGWKVLEHKHLAKKGVLPEWGDQGLDLVLENKEGNHFLVQVKNYTQMVDNKAVQECIAAKEYYKGDFKIIGGAVVTNSAYKKSAITLAERAGIELIDGKRLEKMITEIRAESGIKTAPKASDSLVELFKKKTGT